MRQAAYGTVCKHGERLEQLPYIFFRKDSTRYLGGMQFRMLKNSVTETSPAITQPDASAALGTAVR